MTGILTDVVILDFAVCVLELRLSAEHNQSVASTNPLVAGWIDVTSAIVIIECQDSRRDMVVM